MELLREAGAREIHFRLGAPPVRFPCFYGIDTPKHSELLAQNMTIREIQDFLRVDSLGFLSIPALKQALGHNCCTACFDGTYHDPCAQALGNPERSYEP
jgi:amidophosphoribosyltransferase